MTPVPPTEQRNNASMSLDAMSTHAILALMDREDQHVLSAVAAVNEELSVVATRIAECFLAAGRTVIIGSGTSGRLAEQEVAELAPTFGVPARQFVAMAAGKQPSALASTEDDTSASPSALQELRIGANDVVIGVTASGSTPFVRSGIVFAAGVGAWTCAITNNPDAPLLAEAAFGIMLDTGPEIVTGSTRLKAGTAQKLALNRITTAALVRAGRVISNHMVDLNVTNEKLRRRAIRIVTELAGSAESESRTALERANWSVREALALMRS